MTSPEPVDTQDPLPPSSIDALHVSEEDEDDEFGEFGEFDEFSDSAASTAPVEPNNEQSPVESMHNSPHLHKFTSNAPVPLKSSTIHSLPDEAIRANLTSPPSVTDASSQDDAFRSGITPTSQQLWQHLTETTWMPLPKWDGSPIHRQLALCLGVPLNLDKSLPKAVTRKMDLPTQNTADMEGMQHVPEWSLLSVVSEEALEHKSEDELHDHIQKLESALRAASDLKESMESKEMDLQGEKNILEGMVESLLVFSQRNQREKLKRKVRNKQR